MMLLCIYFLQYSKFVCLFLFLMLLWKLQWCANTQLTHSACRLLACPFARIFRFSCNFKRIYDSRVLSNIDWFGSVRFGSAWLCVHYEITSPIHRLMRCFFILWISSLCKSLKWKHFPIFIFSFIYFYINGHWVENSSQTMTKNDGNWKWWGKT